MGDSKLRNILRHKVDIAKEIGHRTPLEISGDQFRCQCPRHQDSTDPLYITPEKSSFTCFGCGWSGDIVDFIAETDKISEDEAMERLTSELHIEATEIDEAENKKQDVGESTSTPSPPQGIDIEGLAKQLNLTPEKAAALLAQHTKAPEPEDSKQSIEIAPTNISQDDKDQEIEAICSSDNLLLAWRKVKAFAREHDVYFDSNLFDLYEQRLDANIQDLSLRLAELTRDGKAFKLFPVSDFGRLAVGKSEETLW